MNDAVIEPPLWLFLHVPKTGGTTFKAHLERYLVWDEEVIDYSGWGRRYRAKQGRPEFAQRPKEERAKALVLAGHRLVYGEHRLVPGRTPRYVTFLREPAERCVSLYNFRRSRGVTKLDFEDWYRTEFLGNPRNRMVDFYAERLLPREMLVDPEARITATRKLLRLCWHVGLTETLDSSLALLCSEMGIPADWKSQRVAGSNQALLSATHPDRGERIARLVGLDDNLRARVHADAPDELALYRWVRAGMPD